MLLLLTQTYGDSTDFIKKGDAVVIDGVKAVINEVCLPQTKLAEDYSCSDTGGILVKYNDGVVALLPFGTMHWVEKAPTA